MPRLEAPIKLIYAVASNALINQHANINRTAKILQDERLVEFLVVQDNFLTPSARFADIVLPACTQLETWGVEDGWKYGDEVLLMPKVVEPAGEARSDYRICSDIAERLGVKAAFTEGRTERDWVEAALTSVPAGLPGPADARRSSNAARPASTRCRSRSRPSPSPTSAGIRRATRSRRRRAGSSSSPRRCTR